MSEATVRPFTKVLIANRGKIAMRVLRAPFDLRIDLTILLLLKHHNLTKDCVEMRKILICGQEGRP